MMQTNDVATSLRSGCAQLLGVPPHHALLGALCRAGIEDLGDDHGEAVIRIRRRSAPNLRANDAVEVGAREAAGPVRALVRQVAHQLDLADRAPASATIEDWEVIVPEAAGGSAVLLPHDPARTADWRVSLARGRLSVERIGRAWQRATSDFASRCAEDPVVDLTRVLLGRPMLATGDTVLTLIHGADGSVAPFAPLAARLPFAVRAFRGVPALMARAASLRDLARRYADLLCELDDRPLHWIGGHSFGAIVAREMAALLEARGKRLGAVFSLDPSLALAARERPSDDRSERLTLLKAMGPPADVERLVSAPAGEAEIDAHLQRRLPGGRLRQVLDMRRRCLAFLESRGEPAPAAARVTHLHAREPWHDDWHALALGHRDGGIEVPGDHFSMLAEPHVARVASIIQSCCPGARDD